MRPSSPFSSYVPKRGHNVATRAATAKDVADHPSIPFLSLTNYPLSLPISVGRELEGGAGLPCRVCYSLEMLMWRGMKHGRHTP